jgi:hypothetical protein
MPFCGFEVAAGGSTVPFCALAHLGRDDTPQSCA